MDNRAYRACAHVAEDFFVVMTPLAASLSRLTREIYRSSFFVFFSPLSSLFPLPPERASVADGKHHGGEGRRERERDGSEPYLFLVDLFRLIHLLSRDSIPPPFTYFHLDLFPSYKCWNLEVFSFASCFSTNSFCTKVEGRVSQPCSGKRSYFWTL